MAFKRNYKGVVPTKVRPFFVPFFKIIRNVSLRGSSTFLSPDIQTATTAGEADAAETLHAESL